MYERHLWFCPHLSEVDITRVIHVIEKNGGDYQKHMTGTSTDIQYLGTNEIRISVVNELKEHHYNIFKNLT